MVSLRLPPTPTVRDIIKLYRLSAIKQLSQNFLMNEALTDKIVKSVGKIYNSQVLEVGPGPGGITRSILKKNPKKLIVVEKDQRFRPILDLMESIVSASDVDMTLIYNDIMSINTKDVFSFKEKKEWNDECPNIFIVGNLPFSISTALIIKWLHAISKQTEAWSHGRVRMTLTFQKEVAERLVADVMENQRCRLSVMAQTWTLPKLQFIIPGKLFF
ncbi:hypothetical protein TSAR_006659 [Trichomalopsis sarcophagae]|uniref:rRNA adenine N(6)-methyltransferase n=1 Tax=Trichomalopsis sarcophagae TaxID=543379 RepID=A0A232EX34_9HYME|nr:hypothetical protein TSAR_006659 [Trichomalopsis sarcophagae]